MPVTRRQLNFDFTADGEGQGFLDPLLTFSRSSTATRINAAGVLETVAANAPRFDFDPVSRRCRGLLMESQSTNYLTISTTPSFRENGTVADCPDACPIPGAKRVTATAQGRTGNDFASGLGAAVGWFTFSVWLKAVSGTPTVSLVAFKDNDTAVGSVDVVLSTTWKRYSLTYLVSSPSNLNRVAVAASVSHDIAGWQHELGRVASSYIPTSGSATTRSADVCFTEAMAPWYSNSHTFMVESTLLPGFNGNDVDYFRLAPDLFTDWNNRTTLFVYSGNVFAEYWLDGTVGDRLVGSIAAGGTAKVAISKSQGQQARVAYNGSEVAPFGFATTLRGFSRLSVGCDYSGAGQLNGHVKRLLFLPFAADDYTLKALTQ